MNAILKPLAVSSLILAAPVAAGAPGDADISFGGTGRVTHTFGAALNHAKDVAVQTDGKIVVVGTTQVGTTSGGFAIQGMGILRLHPDGSLDSTFGGSGKVTLNLATNASEAEDVVLQPDGKIVIGGYRYSNSVYALTLTRLLPNGSLDTTFGVGGVAAAPFVLSNITCGGLALQADGKIVLGGNVAASFSSGDALVARFDPAGTLDASFRGVGYSQVDFVFDRDVSRDICLSPDGRIRMVATARSTGFSILSVASFMPDGSPDIAFNGDGKVVARLSNGDSVASVASSGSKVVVAGSSSNGSNNDALVCRFDATGNFDATFNGSGFVKTDFANSNDTAGGVAVQSDGKIVVCGASASTFMILRYNADGALDTTFNATGKVNAGSGSGNAIAIQNDGKIVAVGLPDFTVVRYHGASPAADIDLVDSAGNGIPDGTGAADFGRLLTTGDRTLGFAVKSVGAAPLTGLGITISGPNAGEFIVVSSPVAPLPGPSGSSPFSVRFVPVSPGAKSATLHIASNDPDAEGSYEIALSGFAMAPDADNDGDSISNEAELAMEALGFDPEVSDSGPVALLRENGLSSGIGQQFIALSRPVLERDTVTGQFHLSFGLETSPDLLNWSNLTGFTPTFDPVSGRIVVGFSAGGLGTEFFRVFAEKP